MHGTNSGRAYWQNETYDLEFDAFTLSASGSGHTPGCRPAAGLAFGTAFAQDAQLIGGPGGAGIVCSYPRDVGSSTGTIAYTQAVPVQSGVYGTALTN